MDALRERKCRTEEEGNEERWKREVSQVERERKREGSNERNVITRTRENSRVRGKYTM